MELSKKDTTKMETKIEDNDDNVEDAGVDAANPTADIAITAITTIADLIDLIWFYHYATIKA